MIVLDTHIWIWWVQGDDRLTERQEQELRAAEAEGGIGVSAVSCSEVALLSERGRITLPVPLNEWIGLALRYPGVRALDLTPDVAVASTQLAEPLHRDPADRFLIATARHYDCPLVTSDR